MSDDPNDPWRSLADQLGVQPGEEPPAPQPPPAPKPPQRAQTSSAPVPPSKKSKSDWNALAGELGLEVSPQPEGGSSVNDPVAELLGFPPPSSFSTKRETDEGRPRDEAYAQQDDDVDPRPSNSDRWRDDDSQQRRSNLYDDTKPVYDDTAPPDFNQRDDGGYRDRPPTDQQRENRPGRRRRGRGGRGRGEQGREGRGGRPGYQQRESRSYDNNQREPDSERPIADDSIGVPPSFSEDLPAESSGGNRPEGGLDDGSHKRRRRRRGRGGRPDRTEHRPDNHRNETSQSDDDTAFLEVSSDEDLAEAADVASLDFADAESHFGAETGRSDDLLGSESVGSLAGLDEHDDPSLDGDENHTGKNSVRDILTWTEAIGMIIEGNLQARASAPHSSQHSHSRGQRGGRGRGRGRGGNRR